MSASSTFNRKFSKRSLSEIYKNRIKNSGAIGIDRVRPANIEKTLKSEVEFISERVKSGAFKFTPYKEKLILKGATSCPRQISIPTARDRIVLRALCDSLAVIFPESKLALPQTVIESLSAALASGKYSEYIKVDLQKFYPSIPHELIEKSIKNKIRKVEFRELINAAITTATVPEAKGGKNAPKNMRGIPQGLAISNILAETALQTIDCKYKSDNTIWFKRYVDDILILTTRGRSADIADQIIDDLKRLGLSPHAIEAGSKSKIDKLSVPFDFLGYEIDKNQIQIKQSSILRFESSLANILTAYRHRLAAARSKKDKERAVAYCSWKLNLRITGCILEGKRLGWVAYFSQISTTTQLRSINHTISKLIERAGLTGKIKLKSLIKTFYELKHGEKQEHKYIPNFDNMTIGQKRERLKMWYGDLVDKFSDSKVERLLMIKIKKAVRELEEDIAQKS
ncbi:reverse transcriptase domain-containing protein [Pseudomonas sp. MH2]|uniref:Reverse transcriptase domain-containing protein n=1 Tax=Pseudomonas machongensis TaxID=3110229 RepID=A0ABU5VJA2_9PSED|nr:reverse transcriptase domain-containing protein [Pseudomonas sp. MH2]MEA5673444.1 reverse transcriptase domain-containing protein [Pseudomonas sp. MH2]